MSDGVAVHVIDDDPVIRDSLEILLATEGFNPRVYASAAKFLEQLETLDDGCIVTDLRMPGMTGIELLEKLQELQIDLPAVVITGDGDRALALQAMKAGATSILEKPFDVADLIACVRVALADKANSPAREDAKAAFAARLTTLSVEERQVFQGMIAGQTSRTIAGRMGSSQRIVDLHRSTVMLKMQARDLSELLRMALAAGEEVLMETKGSESAAMQSRANPPKES
ncbi:two component transcriptional regulator, LuxR family [Rhodoblastus acidophilus]|uniref:Two component transcriptional regulator, LuxR family n=1 Tax=Rhodoblastus acidophilus TaxID=1074 RepID=A0A212PXX7_RHOAC|nr:response regulator [Rhodoblastus acidophilus]PPQ38750.1 hypothetical protein CKO16_09070 [Rhodoblastus acidophilus]RAI20782.1 hypothetical protein CH337_09135 [Rhodoblastus acidophilus]SNB51945.1 two component transcriptional regulator, LuxR family [Rhodoblastus acidophilus]